MVRLAKLSVFAATLVMLGLTDATGDADGRRVTAAELGDRWPLTVREGKIACIPGPVVPGIRRVDAVVLHSRGKTYALNGAAKSRGYLPIEPIWKNDPAIPGLRINIGPLIDLALKECR